MKVYLKVITIGIIFLSGFILIPLLPSDIYSQGFKNGLKFGWVVVNFMSWIIMGVYGID